MKLTAYRFLVCILCFSLFLCLLNTGNAACSHPNASVVYSSDYGIDRYDNGNGTHTRVLITDDVVECPDCGEMWDVFHDDKRYIVEGHFFSNGVCTCCGASEWIDITVRCRHERKSEKEQFLCRLYTDLGDGTHQVDNEYTYYTVCLDCGETIDTRDGSISAVEPHTFANGKCTGCGATEWVDITHRHNWSDGICTECGEACPHYFTEFGSHGSEVLSCVPIDSNLHSITVKDLNEIICADCGITLDWKVTVDTFQRPHFFLPGSNICGECQWEKPIANPTAAGPTAISKPTAEPTIAPPASGTKGLYLVPDSDTRQMTESECWNWNYEALGYIYHEIFARHGYIFQPGGIYASYFTSQPWYHPIASQNNQDVINCLNGTEWYNINLIFTVRSNMINQGYTNPNGRSVPGQEYINHSLAQPAPGSNEPVGAGFY